MRSPPASNRSKSHRDRAIQKRTSCSSWTREKSRDRVRGLGDLRTDLSVCRGRSARSRPALIIDPDGAPLPYWALKLIRDWEKWRRSSSAADDFVFRGMAIALQDSARSSRCRALTRSVSTNESRTIPTKGDNGIRGIT